MPTCLARVRVADCGSERHRRAAITIPRATIRKITIQKPSTIGPKQPGASWCWCQKVSKNRARGLENGGGWGTGNGGEVRGKNRAGGGTWCPRKGHRNSCAGVLCLWQDPKLLKNMNITDSQKQLIVQSARDHFNHWREMTYRRKNRVERLSKRFVRKVVKGLRTEFSVLCDDGRTPQKQHEEKEIADWRRR